MSFAVTAASKALKAKGVSHIVTAGGMILLASEADEAPMSFAALSNDEFEALSHEEFDAIAAHVVEAYDPNAKVPAFVKAVKQGKKWVITRNSKKLVPARQYYRELMAAKRASGKYKPKATGKKYPKRAAAIKKAFKNPKTLLGKKHAEALKKAEKKAKSKKAAKPVAKKAAGKKVAKPAAKKVASKKPAGKPAKKSSKFA